MFLAFSGTPAHNHFIVWEAMRIALWKRGGGGGEGRWRRVGGAGVRGKEKREGREGERRRGQDGWEVQRKTVQEQEDRSTAGTNGLLGLGSVPLTKMLPAQC